MGQILFVLWMICGVVAFAVNRDVISPTKFLLLGIAMHFGGVVVEQGEPPFVILCVGIFIALAFVSAMMERRRRPQRKQQLPIVTARSKTSLAKWRVAAILWAASTVPIGVYLYMILSSGGLANYIEAMKGRVQEWRGLGPVLIFIIIFPAINSVYFVAVLNQRRKSRSFNFLYVVHLLITVSFMLLSGSRTQTLNVLAVAIILFDYLRRRVPITMFAACAALFILAAGFLGFARERYRIDDGRLDLGITNSESVFKFNGFTEGLLALRVLNDATIDKPLLGTTFLTVFTNPIPRLLWEEKPDTGGVVFTKQYLDNAWDGLSYATPGFLGESIMNFGKIGGLVIGPILFYAMICWVQRRYRLQVQPLRYQNPDFFDGLALLIYVYALQYIVALTLGEFTNTTIPFLMNVGWLVFMGAVIKKHGRALGHRETI